MCITGASELSVKRSGGGVHTKRWFNVLALDMGTETALQSAHSQAQHQLNAQTHKYEAPNSDVCEGSNFVNRSIQPQYTPDINSNRTFRAVTHQASLDASSSPWANHNSTRNMAAMYRTGMALRATPAQWKYKGSWYKGEGPSS